MDQLTLIIISALVNGAFAAVGLYIGFTKGTGKTIDIAIDKLEKRTKNSPTMQRLSKIMETSDKLFGDESLVVKATKFFDEATALVSSPEAKNFFKNAAELMKGLSVNQEKPKVPEPD